MDVSRGFTPVHSVRLGLGCQRSNTKFSNHLIMNQINKNDQMVIDPIPWKTCALSEMAFAARCVLARFYGITDVARGNECEKLRQCITFKMGWIITPNDETHKSDLNAFAELIWAFEDLATCKVDEIVTFGDYARGAARHGFKVASLAHEIIFKYNTTIQHWLEQNRKKG